MAARVIVDGSILEGGGQILRNSVSLAALLHKDLTITRIRNGRSPPGLKNQHRTGLQLASEITNSTLTGATNGSTEIHFSPGHSLNTSNHFTADSVTAGATTLLLQIAFPLLLFNNNSIPSSDFDSSPLDTSSTLTLKGGTNASNAPQIDYTQNIFLPFLQGHMGISAEIQINRRGYFPKGGGILFITVPRLRTPIPPFTLLERGEITSIEGIAHHGGLPDRIGALMIQSAERHLRESGYTNPISIRTSDDSQVNGPGSGIVLWANLSGGGIMGGSALGRKGVDASKVGITAASSLLKAISDEGCVDEYLQDQIILFMALASGRSSILCGRSDLTLHTKTAIHIAEQLTDAKFQVFKDAAGLNVIQCDGIGFQPQ